MFRNVLPSVLFMLVVGIAAGLIQGASGQAWLLLIPFLIITATILAVAVKTIRQVRGVDVPAGKPDIGPLGRVGKPDVDHPLPNGRQAVPLYRRVRIIAAFLFLQGVIIFTIFAATTGNFLVFLPLGFGISAATAIVMCLTWVLSRRSMEKQGYRW
jgi:membrane protein implicated in regulation of membrane protease activity